MAAKNPDVVLPKNVEVAIGSIRQLGIKIHTWSTNMEEAALRVFSQLSPAQMLAIHEDTAHTLESLNDPMGKIFEKMMKKQVDEIRKAFDSESSTSPAATFMKEFNLRFIKMFDDFITWSAEGVCRQLIELPRLIDAESTETQILLQLQLKGQRPISESLTRELSVTVQSCGMPFFGPATLDKLILLNFARDSPNSIISIELPTSAGFALKQCRSVSVEVALSGEHIPGSPFTLSAARPDKEEKVKADPQSLWTNVGEGHVPTPTHNYSRLDESDLRCVLNDSAMPSPFDEADRDQRSDSLNRSAFNKSRSRSNLAVKLPTVQEASIENTSGSSGKNGQESINFQDGAKILDKSLDVTFPDEADLNFSIVDASMLNQSGVLNMTWGANNEENPTEKAERLAALLDAKQSAQETQSTKKTVEAAGFQFVKNMLEPISNTLAGPSTLGTPKSVRSKIEEFQQLSSPIVASSDSRRAFTEKMTAESLYPDVSSTVDFSEVLSRMKIGGKHQELSSMEDETTVEGKKSPPAHEAEHQS